MRNDTTTHFAIRIARVWRPLLAVFGAIRRRSYVTVAEDALHIRLGFFAHAFPREQIVAVGHVRHGRLRLLANGIGWHTDFRRLLTINGSLAGMVEIEFATAQRFRLLGIPSRCTRLRISLEDPDAFVEAVDRGSPREEWEGPS